MNERPSSALTHAIFLGATMVGLASGGLFWVMGGTGDAHVIWATTTMVALGPAVVWLVFSPGRRQPGVDIIAVLALAGTLVVGQYLAGAIIAVMLASGRTLEAWAGAKAHRELSRLIGRTPRTVQRHENGELAPIPMEDVQAGDVLLVRAGEVVPVDGVVTGAVALMDESALTGEPLPVERRPGEGVRSGSVCGQSV